MAAKRGFRVRLSTVNARSFGAAPRRGRVAIAVTAASAICLLASASPALADVGSVYFDANENAAAGETLFNGTFTGCCNVGLGRSVMTNLTTGNLNVAIGASALESNTT